MREAECSVQGVTTVPATVRQRCVKLDDRCDYTLQCMEGAAAWRMLRCPALRPSLEPSCGEIMNSKRCLHKAQKGGRRAHRIKSLVLQITPMATGPSAKQDKIWGPACWPMLTVTMGVGLLYCTVSSGQSLQAPCSKHARSRQSPVGPQGEGLPVATIRAAAGLTSSHQLSSAHSSHDRGAQHGALLARHPSAIVAFTRARALPACCSGQGECQALVGKPQCLHQRCCCRSSGCPYHASCLLLPDAQRRNSGCHHADGDVLPPLPLRRSHAPGLGRLRLHGIHAPADAAYARVAVIVHELLAREVAYMNLARGVAFEDVAEHVLHDACMTAFVGHQQRVVERGGAIHRCSRAAAKRRALCQHPYQASSVTICCMQVNRSNGRCFQAGGGHTVQVNGQGAQWRLKTVI